MNETRRLEKIQKLRRLKKIAPPPKRPPIDKPAAPATTPPRPGG